MQAPMRVLGLIGILLAIISYKALAKAIDKHIERKTRKKFDKENEGCYNERVEE